jgi:SAM-dependent methyltransferase
MTSDDLAYVEKLLRSGLLTAPVLELGAGYGGSTCRALIEGAGLTYKTTDIEAGPGVDFVADFEAPDCTAAFGAERFGTVLVLNVLEHTFLPVAVLDNAVGVSGQGGRVVVVTPSMWPVHNFPRDCQRLLPDWYVTYAERRPGVRLLDSAFEFVGKGSVASFTRDGERQLPPIATGLHDRYSRAVHRIFRSSGRGHWTRPHSAIGAVFEKL